MYNPIHQITKEQIQWIYGNQNKRNKHISWLNKGNTDLSIALEPDKILRRKRNHLEGYKQETTALTQEKEGVL